MNAKQVLQAQQAAGDFMCAAAERFIADHADPAPGEACFATAGLTELTIAVRRWRAWTWDATWEAEQE